jgi:hypothetical protein
MAAFLPEETHPMKRPIVVLSAIVGIVWASRAVFAFCGFYVAKADTKLFNSASQVVLVRDGDRTVLTMANDFKGDLKEFAMVIPVPTVIRRDQIRVAERALLDHIDAYSAPRLVEYFDANPCQPVRVFAMMEARSTPGGVRSDRMGARSLGVTVEAQYTVGEYDILILSARESTGLETWLRQNGYRIPAGAADVLTGYIGQNLKFFVAKVNLTEQSKLGYSMLRPIQVEYESPKFMLPIRLGMVNADGPQELFVYALSRRGRVETTNYRTVMLPTGMDIPLFVKGRFPDFYKAMFAQQVKKEDMRAVFTEYAWDMSFCDPCAANPLSSQELQQLGADWTGGGAVPFPRNLFPGSGPQPVFLTRLHLRYDKEHFPEDLVFQETGDRTNFQGRYVLRHAWGGEDACSAVTQYRQQLAQRRENEARTLASLTGWRIEDIRRQMQ